jgi:hypothetical protein
MAAFQMPVLAKIAAAHLRNLAEIETAMRSAQEHGNTMRERLRVKANGASAGWLNLSSGALGRRWVAKVD